jgi:CHAT domain-containing protein
VLSACETGLGEVAGGEGVLGLQRAFQVAGAHTTVTSLWKVDDQATRALMERFYANLWQGKDGKQLSRLEALTEAQLWLLKEGKSHAGVARGMQRVDAPKPTQDGRLPPYYWAAFTLSGDWR